MQHKRQPPKNSWYQPPKGKAHYCDVHRIPLCGGYVQFEGVALEGQPSNACSKCRSKSNGAQ